jgi:hypothetical protein
MIPAIKIIMGVFAVFRLARLIAIDDGPFLIFLRLRRKAEELSDAEEVKGIYEGFWFGIKELLSCIYCQGYWWSLIILILFLLNNPIGDLFIFWNGLAGMQAFLWRLKE